MRDARVTVAAEGARYRLGRTESYGGIWKKRPWGWRLVARYPLTEAGWTVAQEQFAMWEPGITGPAAAVADASSRRRWLVWGVPGLVVVLVGAAAGLYFGHVVKFSASPTSKAAPTHAGTPQTTTAPSTKPAPQAVGSGFLARGSTWAIYIQWNDENGQLNGTAQEITTTGSPPTEHLTTGSISVVGQINGTRIALSFNGGVQQFGTLSNGSFTIDFPQSGGMLAPVTFRSASTSQYNLAVASVQQRLAAANSAAQAAQQRAQTEASITHDARAVLAWISTLQTQEASLTNDVGAVATALKSETTTLTKTQAAVSTVRSCLTANQVGYSANQVGYAANQVGYAANSVKSDIAAIRSGIASLTTAATALASAESNFPGYLPADQPTPSAVTQAVGAAGGAATSAIGTTNGYIAQANADVTTALGVAAHAEQAAGCSTSATSSFTPVPTIT